MKVKWNDKYTTVSVYSFIVIAFSIIFYNIVSKFGDFKVNLAEIAAVMQPFIIGFIIAYLLNFILKFIEEKCLKNCNGLRPKSKRLLSLLITYLTASLFIYTFAKFVLPQLANSLVGLVNNIPSYVHNMSDLFDNSSKHIHLDDKYLALAMKKWNEFLNYILDFAKDLMPLLADSIKIFASSVLNIILGFIISVYLLIDKEKFFGLGKKTIKSLFSAKTSRKILELTHRTNGIFGKFISGKLLDSFIVAWITFFILIIFKMPYASLVSFIVGITNIIPFFGPFIGAVPSILIILFVSPVKALWFVFIILFIQQLDGNVIGPKILGDSLGISAFWILFSLLVASKLMGIVGMIIGVPLFAVFYSIVKDIIESRLEKKGFPKDTENYM